jgi:hypothetical protein
VGELRGVLELELVDAQGPVLRVRDEVLGRLRVGRVALEAPRRLPERLREQVLHGVDVARVALEVVARLHHLQRVVLERLKRLLRLNLHGRVGQHAHAHRHHGLARVLLRRPRDRPVGPMKGSIIVRPTKPRKSRTHASHAREMKRTYRRVRMSRVPEQYFMSSGVSRLLHRHLTGAGSFTSPAWASCA